MQIVVGESAEWSQHGNVAPQASDHESSPLFGFADEPAEMSA